MVVLFATLGFTPQAVIPALKHIGDLERVVIFHSLDKRSRDAKEEVRKSCESIGVECKPCEITDVYSITDSVREMSNVIKNYATKDVVFNITGGTKMIASAALLLCVMKGVKAIYVRETDGKVLDAPMLRMSYSDALTEKEKEALRVIASVYEKNFDREKGRVDLSIVYEELEKKNAKSVISGRLSRLSELGLIEMHPDERNGRKKYLVLKDAAKLYLLLEN
jgi:CRISPR locus-related DNA-binding protein